MAENKNIRKPTEEESKFFWWSALIMMLSLVAWLWGHFCACRFASEYLATIVAGVAGGVLTSSFLLYQQRVRRDLQRQAFFRNLTRSVWKRKVAYQYSTPNAPQPVVPLVPDLDIRFVYTEGCIIHIEADYGDQWGQVRGKVEFRDDNRLVGHGTYVYTSGDLAKRRIPSNPEASEFIEVAHSGKYTLHLFPDHDQNTIRVFYEGLIPNPAERGFEIWHREDR